MADTYLNHLLVLFGIVDPVGIAWLFAAMTHGVDPALQWRMALRGCLLAGVILIGFFFGGTVLLQWFGITIPAFRIAGGILLFLVAIDMVFARQSGLRSTTSAEQLEAAVKEDISVFPLAFPLLAGPGAITTVLLMSSTSVTIEATLVEIAIILFVMVSCVVALRYAPALSSRLGETGANVISRMLGLLVAALAVQYVLDGAMEWALSLSLR